LAIPYPHPSAFPVFLVVLCTLLLAGVTVLVLWAARTKPYAAVGWFWFLGTLVPVIGLVQVGNTPVADRFTYVPQIGLYLAVAWAIRDLTVSWRHRRQALGTVVTMVITALMVCAWKQTSYWRNSESLWTHTLACTSDNFIGCYNLGTALLQKGDVDEAIAQYQQALQIKPDFAEAHSNLGNALFQKGKVDEAIAHCQRALQIKPDYPDVLNNLAWLLATGPDAHIRDGVQAVRYAGRACELTHYQKTIYIGTLAAAYAEAGRFDDAISMAEKACTLASAAGEHGLLKRNQDLLASYLKHQPYHETTKP
jgi:tetratricopeptide (TPR) repeat protein